MESIANYFPSALSGGGWAIKEAVFTFMPIFTAIAAWIVNGIFNDGAIYGNVFIDEDLGLLCEMKIFAVFFIIGLSYFVCMMAAIAA